VHRHEPSLMKNIQQRIMNLPWTDWLQPSCQGLRASSSLTPRHRQGGPKTDPKKQQHPV
jgi:hypothetical protein